MREDHLNHNYSAINYVFSDELLNEIKEALESSSNDYIKRYQQHEPMLELTDDMFNLLEREIISTIKELRENIKQQIVRNDIKSLEEIKHPLQLLKESFLDNNDQVQSYLRQFASHYSTFQEAKQELEKPDVALTNEQTYSAIQFLQNSTATIAKIVKELLTQSLDFPNLTKPNESASDLHNILKDFNDFKLMDLRISYIEMYGNFMKKIKDSALFSDDALTKLKKRRDEVFIIEKYFTTLQSQLVNINIEFEKA
jgi:hypothetical protein